MTAKTHDIAKRAKEALFAAGIKNKSLASEAGLSAATVSDYLNGNIRIPLDVIAVIAEMTGEQLDWLILGNTSPIQQRDGRMERVEEERATYNNPSQIDTELLARAIERTHWIAEQTGKDLDPQRIATVATYLYQMAQEHGESMFEEGKLRQIITLAS